MSLFHKFSHYSSFHHCLRLLTLGLLAFPALEILYGSGWSTTADGDLHLMRLTLLDHAMQQGIFYPRWIPDLFLGHGYPLFNYYAPALYYVAQGFHLASLNVAQAWLLTAIVLIWAAAYGMYLFAQDFFCDVKGKFLSWPAVIAAIAYIYAPYLLSNLYIRGAFPELAAQALLPWIFWAFRRLFTTDQPAKYGIIASLSLAGLAITHNITLLIVPPLLIAYLLLLAWQEPLYRKSGLSWSLVAVVGSMSLSAFFWIPMILERGYLAKTAYNIDHLPNHVWNLQFFLDLHWPFDYRGGGAFKLGIAQLTIGIFGFLLAKNKTKEWYFWLSILILSSIGISNLSLPFWSSHEILAIIQFPWRLLMVVGFVLAIFSGGIVLCFSNRTLHFIGAFSIVIIIIWGARPQIERLDITPAHDIFVDLEAIASYEANANAWGAGWDREFLPRWGKHFNLLADETHGAEYISPKIDIEIVAAHPYHFLIKTESTEASTLRLQQFYFPGWQASLSNGHQDGGHQGGSQLEPYPTANGLWAVDIPPGHHLLQIDWIGTSYQKIGGAISLVAIMILLVLLLWYGSPRGKWVLILACVFFGLLAMLYKSETKPFLFEQTSPVRVGSHLQLLGYQTHFSTQQTLQIFPYWWVGPTMAEATAEALEITWQLVDQNGMIQIETHATPYFGTISSAKWPTNTIVRDAYQLRLPAGLQAGVYQLAVKSEQVDVVVGEVRLEHDVVSDKMAYRVDIQLREDDLPGVAWLDSFNQMKYPHLLNRFTIPPSEHYPEQLLAVAPGDTLAWRLHWRAEEPLSAEYHSFLHLVDANRHTLATQDHLPGTRLSSSRLWNRYRARPDTYLFKIPPHAAGGLYWPRVGLYRYENKHRLDIYDPAGTLLGDGFDLPPFKVYVSASPTPHYPMQAHFDGLAEFLGYDLERGTGETLFLTFYYRVRKPQATNYKRFVHLYHPELGMAAQFDSWPQNGGNPTNTWLPDEIVTDPVRLEISDKVQPGTYDLFIGFYDPETGERIEVFAPGQDAYVNRLLPLTEIEVSP